MNNFEILKIETSQLIKNQLTACNEKTVINFINTILSKFNSQLEVRKNMSIASFETLLLNSNTPEEFQKHLLMLDVNKDYEIESAEGIKESIEFNETYVKEVEGIEAYNIQKKFLDSRIQLNENLFIIEYPKNE